MGFEPTVPFDTTVFKTAAFDHSATSPYVYTSKFQRKLRYYINMKYLGIDYGTKKVGIAISDPNGILAFPYFVIKNDDTFLNKVEDIVNNENIDELVIGDSKNFKGEDNVVMEAIKNFVAQWSIVVGTPVHFEKEFLTTHQAKLHTDDKMADASAAAIILQTYLDRQK